MKKKTKIPAAKWKTLNERWIKNEDINLSDLLMWVRENVPPDTNNRDVLLSFEVDETWDNEYSCGVEANMILKIRKD